MTFRAPDVLMSPAQRELRPLIVIEERRLPFHAVVTFNTSRDSRLAELFSVDILVAVFAQGRRRFEIHIDQLGLEVGRFVAIDATSRTVGSDQRKRRFCMVEAR